LQFFAENGVKTIDGVILTHGHADAIFGLDDLRMWTQQNERPIDVYLSQATKDVISQVYPYLVDVNKSTGGGGVASINFHTFHPTFPIFNVAGLDFLPIEVFHGENYICLGFRFENISYISDVSAIPEKSVDRIKGSTLLILDSLNLTKTHPSHFTMTEAVREFERYRPHKGYIVGINHSLDHDFLADRLKTLTDIDVEPAYDGQVVKFPLTYVPKKEITQESKEDQEGS